MPLSVARAAHGAALVTISSVIPREDLVRVLQHICLALLDFCHLVFWWKTSAHDLYELIQMVLWNPALYAACCTTGSVIHLLR